MTAILPIEMQRSILLHSDVTTIHQACYSNSSLARLCRDPIFWKEKYYLDYHQRFDQDAIASQLQLTPRQAYIRRFTYQGGVTYGSEAFLEMSTLLPIVIGSRNGDLITYYLQSFLRLCDKYDQIPREDRFRTDLLTWSTSVLASLRIGDVSLGKAILSIGRKYIQSGVSSFVDTWELDNATVLLDAYEGTISNTYFASSLTGGLLGKHYDLVEEKLLIDSNYKAIRDQGIEIAFDLGEEEWMSRMQRKYPDLILKSNLDKIGILSGVYLDQPILDSYIYDQAVQYIKQSRHDRPDLVEKILAFNPDLNAIPCRANAIEAYRQHGFADEEILQALLDQPDQDCDAETFDWIDKNYPSKLDIPTLLIQAMERRNTRLLLHLVDRFWDRLDDFNPDQITLMSIQAKEYKDLWFLIGLVTNIWESPDLTEENTSVEVYLFQSYSNNNVEASFHASSLSVFT